MFCAAIICPSPPAPLHGSLVPTSEHYVGTTVQSVCSTGYVLVGEPVTRCTQGGIWSHATPQCEYQTRGYIRSLYLHMFQVCAHVPTQVLLHKAGSHL